MPKVLESKFVIKGDVADASSKMKQFREDITAAAEALVKLRDIGLPEGAPTRGVGRRAIAASAPRSPYAPARDRIMERGGFYGKLPFFGWRGYGAGAAALGAAGRTPEMAASIARAGLGGAGVEALGGVLQQTGGGIMGAFGGMGAALGVPLLLGGIGLGLGYMMTQPLQRWGRASGMMATRMGRPWVEEMRGEAARAGVESLEALHWMGQLERSGAQAAFRPMVGLRRQIGAPPEMMFPFFEAMTKAGGVRARTEPEYEKLRNTFKEMAKDIHSLPEYLDQLVTLTDAMREQVGDLGEQGARAVMDMAKWAGKSPYAAVRDVRTLGAVYNWLATPGPPGKQMYLWSLAAASPELKAMLYKSVKEGGFGAAPGTPVTPAAMRWLTTRPQMTSVFLRNLIGMNREAALQTLYQSMSPGKAVEFLDYIKATGLKTPRDLETAKKRYEKEAKGEEDWGVKLDTIATRIEEHKLGLLDPKTVQHYMETEEKVLDALKKTMDKLDFEKMINTMLGAMGLLTDVLSGKKGVKQAFEEALDKYFWQKGSLAQRVMPGFERSLWEKIPFFGQGYRAAREAGEYWGQHGFAGGIIMILPESVQKAVGK